MVGRGRRARGASHAARCAPPGPRRRQKKVRHFQHCVGSNQGCSAAPLLHMLYTSAITSSSATKTSFFKREQPTNLASSFSDFGTCDSVCSSLSGQPLSHYLSISLVTSESLQGLTSTDGQCTGTACLYPGASSKFFSSVAQSLTHHDAHREDSPPWACLRLSLPPTRTLEG